MGFDSWTTQLEHRRSLSEQWLTDTNKIYQTNKMIRAI
jgi:hypothetical protein